MKEIWDAIQETGRFLACCPRPSCSRSARIEMLSTGLRAEIGLKVYGDSLRRASGWPKRSSRS
jgi:Cu/Ag efflux pump CusA